MTIRNAQARDVRRTAADVAFHRPHPRHANNGEEFRYRNPHTPTQRPTYLASFTKGLPHDEDGFVVQDLGGQDPYSLFVLGIQSGDVDDFRRTPLGPADLGERLAGGETRADVWTSRLAQQAAGRDGQSGADLRAWESAGAGMVFDLQGPDAQAVTMPPAPHLESDELIAEMAEVYLMALLRDVPFSHFREGGPADARVAEAIDLLSGLDWFDAMLRPRLDAPARLRSRSGLTRQTVFRGIAPGDAVGPYVSQFLLTGNTGVNGGDAHHAVTDGRVSYGAQQIDQRVRAATPGKDYMTTFEQWRDVQNAADVRGHETYADGAGAYRFMATPRDLATYVHYDALYQAYLNACLQMLARGVPFDAGIPFQVADNVDRQQGFAHFGGPHILSLVTEVATRALKAVRYQKFNVHRRARPEAIGWLVHQCISDAGEDRLRPVQPLVEALQNTAFDGGTLLGAVKDHNAFQNDAARGYPDERHLDAGAGADTYLLPMAFPEGSPMHPAYGAGHATVAGACVTILKAYFDHGYVLSEEAPPNGTPGPNKESTYIAYEATDAGQGLRQVILDEPLTVEGELNKLAANIAIGRDWAGVHYFTDYIESLKMGEEIALGILEEQKLTYTENFTMTVPLFSGEVTRI